MKGQRKKRSVRRKTALLFAMFVRRFNFWVALITVPVYLSSLVPASEFWPAGFVSLGIPFFLVLNAALLLISIMRRSPRFKLPLLMLLLGVRFITATFSFHPLASSEKAGKEIKVVSYNVRLLEGGHKPGPEQIILAVKILKWLDSCNADVICLQEFLDKPESRTFNTIERMKASGYKYRYFSQGWVLANHGRVGMAIFSKFPIKTGNRLRRSDKGNNQLIYADIKTPSGMVRVYNIHLASLHIREREIEDNDTPEEMEKHARSVIGKIKRGFRRRGLQTDALESNLDSCQYPVILCGDLNDPPCSNTYFRIRDRMNNAFESAGNGFGISYLGFIPFLRIDNQFVDKRFKITSFRTHREATWSDHYPISATYILEKD